MNPMTIARASFYPLRAWMDVVGDAAPEPFRSVINAYFNDKGNTALRLQAMNIRLGVWTNDDSTRVQELQDTFWDRLAVLIELRADVDPAPLGAAPTLRASMMFGEISGLILSRYNAAEMAPAVADIETGSDFISAPEPRGDVSHVSSVAGAGGVDALVSAALASAAASAAAAAASAASAASVAALAAALLAESRKSGEGV